jgi:hypothetical protein
MNKFRRTGHLVMSAADITTRKASIGGSDAKIIMSENPRSIEQLWLEKRGQIEPEPMSDEAVLNRLGHVTEDLNLDYFELKTGLVVTDEQERAYHPDYDFLHATLDGRVRETEDGPCIGIIDAKFNLPFNDWSIHKALETHWAQLQHNMLVTGTSRAWLSVIIATGGFKYIECEADEFYQVALLQAEMDFWHAVQSGEPPEAVRANINVDKPDPIKVVDMSASNLWVDHAVGIVESLVDFEVHNLRREEIKKLFPADAAVAHGRGVKLKRSKDGKVLFEIDGSKDAKAEAMKRLDLVKPTKPRRSRAKEAA